MLKKDLLIKQMEEFGKVLAALFNLRTRGHWEEFEKEIDQCLMRFTPEQLGFVEELTRDEFREQVLRNDQMSMYQKKLLAGLLFEKLQLYLHRHDYLSATVLRIKCEDLVRSLLQDNSTNEYDLDLHYKLQVLEQMSRDEEGGQLK